MTEIEQRVTIAEQCGFETPEWCCHEENECYFECSEHHNEQINKLPDYLNDLNAMHEAEKVLSTPQHSDYICHLYYKTMGLGGGICDWQDLASATATQRAEAFLKAGGLWN